MFTYTAWTLVIWVGWLHVQHYNIGIKTIMKLGWCIAWSNIEVHGVITWRGKDFMFRKSMTSHFVSAILDYLSFQTVLKWWKPKVNFFFHLKTIPVKIIELWNVMRGRRYTCSCQNARSTVNALWILFSSYNFLY